MAEERVVSPVTPDLTEPVGRNSRRNSLAGAASASSEEKILPRYLRASTGSCHDFCKYGKKHEFEEKARIPFRKRIIKKPSDEQNLFASLDLPLGKKTSAAKSKSVPSSRSHTPATSNVVRQVSTESPGIKNYRINEVLSKKENTSVAKLNPKDISDAIKLIVLTNSTDSKAPRKHEGTLEAKSTARAKFKSSVNLKSRLSETSKSLQLDESTSSDRVRVSSKEVSSKSKEKSISKGHSESLKQKSQAKKLSSSIPSKVFSVRTNSGISDTEMGKRTSKVAAKKVVASTRASLSPRPSIASLNAIKKRSMKVVSMKKNQNKAEKDETEEQNNIQRNETEQQNKTLKDETEQQNKTLKDETEQQNKTIKDETEQPISEHNESDNDALQEKTLYVIKMETDNLMLESDKNENCAAQLSSAIASSPKPASLPTCSTSSSHSEKDQDESEFSVTEAEDEDESDFEYVEDETENMEEAEIFDGENGGRPRKAGMVVSADKNSQPVKLSFRRGRIVDIQSENNGPRRLKFRRGRILGDNQNSKSDGRRTYRRRVVDADLNDQKPGEQKVILRHQDVQGKKDDKGLFNNVIEETASKLVETRKSKVKALVGAFETVISLQDAKPSANTVN